MPEPITVLFVDDEPAVLRFIRRQLASEPYDIVVASSAAEALDTMEKRRIDVLVSDIDMPEMNGLELLFVARQRFPGALRMVLTGAATLERALDAINRGEVSRILPKPFASDVFREIVGSLVDRIEQSRREGEIMRGKARRDQFLEWLNRRFPGTTNVARDSGGRVLIDLNARLSAADRAGSSARAVLFSRSAPPQAPRLVGDTLRPPPG